MWQRWLGTRACIGSASISLTGLLSTCTEEDSSTTISNWSDSHQCVPAVVHTPTSLAQVEAIVREHDKQGKKLRAIGSGLSPNGLGFSDRNESLINLAMCDELLHVDQHKQQVVVESGMLVSNLLEKLKPYGLTLMNVASIRDQQIGGVTQAGCHGTGATIAPLDDHIVSLEVVTPGKGTLILSESQNPELFQLAKCGLGLFGVVTKVTLQCVPMYQLEETMSVISRAQVTAGHARRLKENLHLRYMWIPYTDAVVVIECKEIKRSGDLPTEGSAPSPDLTKVHQLYKSLNKNIDEDAGKDSFTELRSKMLAIDPTNTDLVCQVNEVEADFWHQVSGKRSGNSDDIIGFDCGGQQLVLEVALQCGTQDKPDGKDVDFVQELLEKIELNRIPAPAPIEQRWSARSTSRLSPVSSEDPDALFTWVGIVQYLPIEDPVSRHNVMKCFREYSDVLEDVEHWAKIELPESDEKLNRLRARVLDRFPLCDVNRWRQQIDPHDILSNELLSELI